MVKFNQSGQALTLLLFFVVIAMVVSVATVSLVILNSAGASKYEQSNMALDIAESGLEDGLIRLVRDPSFSGETLTVGTGVATITVSGTVPKVLTSSGVFNTFRRTVQASVNSDGTVSVASWKEVF